MIFRVVSLLHFFETKILYEYCMFPTFCQTFTHSQDTWQTACIANLSLNEILQPSFNSVLELPLQQPVFNHKPFFFFL